MGDWRYVPRPSGPRQRGLTLHRAGLYIYGTCVESSRRVVVKKYDNVYDWFNRFGDMNPEYGSSHFNGHVALGDWQWETPDDETKTIAVMPPGQPHACTKFKSLEAYLELGEGVYQGSGAGTNDEIMLDFSDSAFTPSNILLMSSPSRGDSVTKPIELESVFGKSVLSPKDVRQVAVYSREGTSHWADPWEVASMFAPSFYNRCVMLIQSFSGISFQTYSPL